MASFLFYDLETFGTDPNFNRIAQFAAIRTDEDLNEIGDPMDWIIKPSSDLLPSPQACLVTQVNPWDLLERGEAEHSVIARIHEEMVQPGTCTLGYNSYRFDDAFVRNAFYRNFWPMYRREYENGNSRWDLLNVFRAAWVLRPDGIQWPMNDKGLTSFKLEDLALANDVREGMAHEALSDVRALIALARKLKQAQPKFWQHAFSLRMKPEVRKLLAAPSDRILLHVQGYYGFERNLCTPVLPLFKHPTESNEVVVFDLHHDPQLLLEWTDFGERAPGMRTLRTNNGPMLFDWRHVRDAERARLALDAGLIESRRQWLLDNAHRIRLVDMAAALASKATAPQDVDAAMYGGFFNAADERWMARVRSSAPAKLAELEESGGINARLPELLKRYRARNFPQTLSPAEVREWKRFCREKFDTHQPGLLGDYTWQSFREELARCRDAHAGAPEQLKLLDEVERFGAHQYRESGIV